MFKVKKRNLSTMMKKHAPAFFTILNQERKNKNWNCKKCINVLESLIHERQARLYRQFIADSNIKTSIYKVILKI